MALQNVSNTKMRLTAPQVVENPVQQTSMNKSLYMNFSQNPADSNIMLKQSLMPQTARVCATNLKDSFMASPKNIIVRFMKMPEKNVSSKIDWCEDATVNSNKK